MTDTADWEDGPHLWRLGIVGRDFGQGKVGSATAGVDTEKQVAHVEADGLVLQHIDCRRLGLGHVYLGRVVEAVGTSKTSVEVALLEVVGNLWVLPCGRYAKEEVDSEFVPPRTSTVMVVFPVDAVHDDLFDVLVQAVEVVGYNSERFRLRLGQAKRNSCCFKYL